MRVLFVPMSWYSHYFCMAPLAWAFRVQGHDVRIAAQPGLADAVARSGMVGVTVGHDYDFIRANSELPVKISQLIRDKWGLAIGQTLPLQARQEAYELRFEPNCAMTEAMVDDLVAFTRQWKPDLVVGDPFVYAATVASEVAGVPLVRHLLGPDWLRHIGYFPGYGMPGGPPEPWPSGLRKIYERFDVAVKPDFAVCTVDPCPTSMQVPDVPNRVPVRYTPYNGPGTMPLWLMEPTERRRVCVSWGKGSTHLNDGAGFPVAMVAAALADLDVDVLVAVLKRDQGELPDNLPPNVRVAEGYPLHVLLPYCDAIVNQGGTGTTLTAAVCGLPQVILPQVLDQAFCAERLTSTGAGLTLAGNADSDALAAAVSTVLETGTIHQAVENLQKEIADQPSPADVVRELEKL